MVVTSWLPASMKANTGEVGADVKESVLFADAGHLKDGGLMSQSPSPPFNGSRSFYKEGGGIEQTDQGRSLQSSVCADQYSPF